MSLIGDQTVMGAAGVAVRSGFKILEVWRYFSPISLAHSHSMHTLFNLLWWWYSGRGREAPRAAVPIVITVIARC